MKHERRNTIHPADHWEAWEKAAKEKNQSLAVWMGHRCNLGLKKEIRDKLSKRNPAGRPPKQR